MKTNPTAIFTIGRLGRLVSTTSKMAHHNNSTFPEFVLEKEFQCHNKALIKDVVCKTIEKFVKQPQDVRLSITVGFQPCVSANVVSHEQEAVATIQVDKPGNYYPGGNEQRARDRELKMLKESEEAKRNERAERRKLRFDKGDRKQTRKTNDFGVKRPSNGTTGCLKRIPPPSPFKAELRRLPTGEMYAVQEVVGKDLAARVSSILEEKHKLDVLRRPCSEEMLAVHESGATQDDATDRDASSIESIRTSDVYSPPPESKKSTYFIKQPLETPLNTKEVKRPRGSIKLEDHGNSSKFLAYITVE